MFAKRFKIQMVLIVFVSQMSSAFAWEAGQYGEPSEYFQPVSPLSPELGFSYHHASTAWEGALRGEAEVLHATGSYWLAITQALICREQARALALGNRQRWIEHCIASRNRRALERDRRSSEQRRANEESWSARFAVYRLDDDQLDRTTGAIEWPSALKPAEYAKLRGRLEELFRGQAGYGAVPFTGSDIVRCTNTFSDELRRHRFEIDRVEYLAAQKFLSGLKYEAELGLVRTGLEDPRESETASVSIAVAQLN